MAETIFSVIIKGTIVIYSALLFPLIQKYLEIKLCQYQIQQKEKEDKINQIIETYLIPLRLYLKESYIRLYKINQKVTSLSSHSYSSLLSINSVSELQDKSISWMINEGYYLMSSVYIVGCLFGCMKRIRDNIAFITIPKNQDVELLKMMDEINLAFAHTKGGGVNFMIQLSIAQDIWLKEENRLMTYREFCQMLQSLEFQQWWYKLIVFFIEVEQNNQVKIKRLQIALNKIENLSCFLDQNIGKGDSIYIIKKFIVEDSNTDNFVEREKKLIG